MTHNPAYFYPTDLFNLLIDTIPCLVKSKSDVFSFFKAAGVENAVMAEIYSQWKLDDSIYKRTIVKNVLAKLNEGGDKYLRECREVLKRVAEFESFDTCYPDDVAKAKGRVAEVQKLTNLKDSWTKITNEHERIRQVALSERNLKEKQNAKRKDDISGVKSKLYPLFGPRNPQRRGKDVEAVINDLFKIYDISISEAFTVTGVDGEGIVEQIDGAIEFEGKTYLVEMKWLAEPVGIDKTSTHINRLMLRQDAHGIFISASGYTEPAISSCREFLALRSILLISLEEIVSLLDNERDLKDFLKKKSNAAKLHKNPWYEIL